MDIGIQIQGEFLDMSPNTVFELEEENPFLQLSSEIKGQYSLPVSIPLTEKNIRLIKYWHLMQSRKDPAGIDALLWTQGIQHSRGKLKLETVNGNINQPQRGSISMYYLFGVSDFFKEVENKTLADCDYGTTYAFASRAAFIDHAEDVMNNNDPDNFNYAFFPVVNTAPMKQYPDVFNTIMNNVGAGNTAYPFCTLTFYTMSLEWLTGVYAYRAENVPFPYLVFVLKKIFSTFGWDVHGDIFTDPDIRKTVVLHNKPITSAYAWDMKNHVPKVGIGGFLISLQNRFGWWFDWDYRMKVCTISERKNILLNRVKKDYTSKAGAQFTLRQNPVAKIYALKQTGGETKIDLTNYTYQGAINNLYSLPVASAAQENHLYFILGENAYYFGSNDLDDNPIWEKAADNLFDYIPAGANQDINTGCLIPETIVVEMRNISRAPLSRKYVLPVVTLDPDEDKTDTFYICSNQGMVEGINNISGVDYKYPLGSAGCHDLKGNLKSEKALVYEYPQTAIDESGLYKNNWEYYLTFMKQTEEVSIPIEFTLPDLLNLEYTDTILIRAVEYFIKNPHFSLPLKNYQQVDLVRIN